MARPQKFTVDEVEAALRSVGGLYTLAAKKLGCAPNTVANYCKRNKRLQAIQAELVEGLLDEAEGQLILAIRKGNLSAVIFYLKCKGKARGYVERSEVLGIPDKVTVSLPAADALAKRVAGMTPEQIRALTGLPYDDLAPDPTEEEAGDPS